MGKGGVGGGGGRGHPPIAVPPRMGVGRLEDELLLLLVEGLRLLGLLLLLLLGVVRGMGMGIGVGVGVGVMGRGGVVGPRRGSRSGGRRQVMLLLELE